MRLQKHKQVTFALNTFFPHSISDELDNTLWELLNQETDSNAYNL